jgi:hypothetical protein
MALWTLHRILIGSAIAAGLLFGAWQLARGAEGSRPIAFAAFAAAAALGVYLAAVFRKRPGAR